MLMIIFLLPSQHNCDPFKSFKNKFISNNYTPQHRNHRVSINTILKEGSAPPGRVGTGAMPPLFRKKAKSFFADKLLKKI